MTGSLREAGVVCATDARVVRSVPVCREHVLIEIAVPSFPRSTPGQFLQILCREREGASDTVRAWPLDEFPSLSNPALKGDETYLRRPFSIADRMVGEDGAERLVVISRAVGRGTRWLERLRGGDTLDVTGPLGHGFEIPAVGCSLVLVGGGVGIPPLLYLARRLHELGRREVTVIVGARTRELLPLRLLREPAADAMATECVALPGEAAYPAIVTSDDGTVGYRGMVTDALRLWQEHRGRRDRPVSVFACGPDGMLRSVAEMTRLLGHACQLCIERQMGCGLGTCLSCVTRVRDAAQPGGWRWALACREGPVFERDVLLDYGVGACA